MPIPWNGVEHEDGRLDTLIGQLLTLTRIDSGLDRGAPAAFDLATMVQEIANDADFEARARNRSVSIGHVDSCQISGFEDLLRSAVENVARNAARHTAEGSADEDIDARTTCARGFMHTRSWPGRSRQHAWRNVSAVSSDRPWRFRRRGPGSCYCWNAPSEFIAARCARRMRPMAD